MPDRANTSLLNYSHLLATPASARCCVIVLQAGAPADSCSRSGIKASGTRSSRCSSGCADAVHEKFGLSFQRSVGSVSPEGDFSKVADFLALICVHRE